MAAARPWIRLDAEWEESGWVSDLSGQSRGCWPRLLCWVKLRGKKGRCRWPDPRALAKAWRVPQAAVEAMLEGAIVDHAIERDIDDLVVINWPKYQEPDPTAVDRKRRQRERESATAEPETTPKPMSHQVTHTSRNVTRDTVTRPLTEKTHPSDGQKGVTGKRHRLPPGWRPNERHSEKALALELDLGEEADAFREHHAAKGSLFLDWDLAFHTWLRNAPKFSRGKRIPPNSNGGAPRAEPKGFAPEVLDDLLGPREDSDW
jgi:hypothetical protein